MAKAKASPQHLPEAACELLPNGTDADPAANLPSGGFLKSAAATGIRGSAGHRLLSNHLIPGLGSPSVN